MKFIHFLQITIIFTGLVFQNILMYGFDQPLLGFFVAWIFIILSLLVSISYIKECGGLRK
ncbi:hypothetical protein LCGC14_1395540 [marine sediment metagenome]|uniref:Uncharacterized protein n=1 Tax=marine sediment metagenome TaxID=412755 RepID=A0A0F9JYV3_9ZZZZ